MATGFEQRKRTDSKAPENDQKLDQQQKQDLERVEEGQELSADAAQRLAPQLGNQALAALLGRQGTGKGGAENEQEEELIEEVGEDKDLDQELEAPQMGGGSGGGGGADPNAEGDPWDMSFLFGGDDDADDPRAPTRMRRLRDSPLRQVQEEDPFAEQFEEEEGEAEEDPLAGIHAQLGEIEPRGEADRPGDTVYMTVESSLLDPAPLLRLDFKPEDLVDADGLYDPVGRPAEIGRFLAEAGASAQARAVGRLLGEGLSALMPTAGGFAGGVARLSSLAILAEALEGGRDETDRAVSLALSMQVWDEAVAAARPLAEEGRLHAADVLEAALGGALVESASRVRQPEPSRLGGAALARVVPEGYTPEIPPLTFPMPDAVDETQEDDVLALDALLSSWLQGAEGAPVEPLDAVVLPEHTEPMLHAARYLLNAVGRAQVEFAAAALAVQQVRPGTPVRAVLVHGDKALRQLARSIMAVVNRLEELPGEPIEEAGEAAAWAEQELSGAKEGLGSLRGWAFSSLAGAMDR